MKDWASGDAGGGDGGHWTTDSDLRTQVRLVGGSRWQGKGTV